MTLARKRKITSLQWHIIYALSLWSVYAFMLCRPISSSVAAAGILAGITKEIRQHLRFDKYALWTCTIILHELIIARVPQIPPSGSPQLAAKLLMTLAAARYVHRLGRVFLIEAGRSRPLYDDDDDEQFNAHDNILSSSSAVVDMKKSTTFAVHHDTTKQE
eukprot:CAMPEP_0197300368 /NCGR_PEP_ID=MMETSP0890-20130614/48219_1 /TAXON_ID=44058 ORGANISM="Aureoumbra lagunensis, Strain CCMP1510" /NCGR_SAMPLE_ID=MMETSP0890 /ASSEMBLY_ACC=CAM_ASM_000533 /LENGTH=160 /DNA_ID=CAMNT_0042779175 /DNA_START=562 /DNA_END=1044 /DNA_ORIENTATION=-